MNKKEFRNIRKDLGKSQSQLGILMGISTKTVQSFEQGWRNVPLHAERQLLFLLFLKRDHKKHISCWNLKKCSKEIREHCPTWEFKAHNLCWFINGTFCEGIVQHDWRKKITICKKCDVFKKVFAA